MNASIRLAAVMAVAVGGMLLMTVGVASASASAVFEAESYPTPGVGLRTPTAEPSKNNGFEIAGATSDCGEASFKSTVGYTGPVSAVAVAPTYKECWTQIGSSVYLTEVNTKACQYEFTAGEKGSEPAGHYVKGTVSVVDCPSISPIIVTVRDTTKWEEKSTESVLCTVEVSESGNSGLKEIKYEDFGSGSGREVKVEADVTGISFISKGCPAGVATSGSNGVYQAATAITAKTKPATVKLTSPSEPVTANVQGYEFSKTKKIGVFVETVEPLPNETTIDGLNTIVEDGKEVPVINWEREAPITTKGCKGGKVAVSIEAENTVTHVFEHREATLTESPTGSGKFSGYTPIMHPLHGKATMKITVSKCEHSYEEKVFEFKCYIDPSGIVVDGNHGDAPVWEATVSLLTSATESGTYTAVPNGSTVMSPMNRVNPDETRENGSFGWEVEEGYYKVEATKTGCGAATTPAFHVPPPVENLEIVLHCEGEQWKLGEEGAEKPQLAVTAPAKTCEGNVRVENVSFGVVPITILKETGIECAIKAKGCEAKKLNKAEKCESVLEAPGTKPEYELEVEWQGEKFTRKFPA